jgi:hypothetical protein
VLDLFINSVTLPLKISEKPEQMIAHQPKKTIKKHFSHVQI